MSIIGGKLKLKGSFQRKSEKEKRAEEKEEDLLESEKINFNEGPKELQKIEFAPEPGTGRIITSGTTVHGKETKFMSQIKSGDFIIIQHPTTFQKEERELVVVLSDKSASLRTPFSSDLVSFSQFDFRKKAEFREPESLEQKFEERLESMSKKIKKPESMLEYREKTGMWGYKTIKQKFEKELTKEELLDMRAKKSRDKFCWI